MAVKSGGAEETVYALKALHKGRILALHAAPRVALEKEALGALSFHPYVTTLHATFQDASTLYFILEFIVLVAKATPPRSPLNHITNLYSGEIGGGSLSGARQRLVSHEPR